MAALAAMMAVATTVMPALLVMIRSFRPSGMPDCVAGEERHIQGDGLPISPGKSGNVHVDVVQRPCIDLPVRACRHAQLDRGRARSDLGCSRVVARAAYRPTQVVLAAQLRGS